MRLLFLYQAVEPWNWARAEESRHNTVDSIQQLSKKSLVSSHQALVKPSDKFAKILKELSKTDDIEEIKIKQKELDQILIYESMNM